MKRVLAIILLGLGVGLLVYFFFFHKAKVDSQTVQPVVQNQTSEGLVSPAISAPRSSIFVPSWSTASDEASLTQYNSLLYVGVPATTAGLQTSSTGYQNIDSFLQEAPTAPAKYLTIQMVNSSTNLAVLDNLKGQDIIVQQATSLAKEKGFSGIVLDFELFSLFDSSIPTKINTFAEKFYNATRPTGLKFDLTIYGDTFYRKRPYDVKFLATRADEILVMAYDFHKASGEPGPNFPLSGRDKYGYDMHQMTDDFLAVVPSQKLTVIFGMYGYDWTVDENKRPVKAAAALSDKEIQNNYRDNCDIKDCVLIPDPLSSEKEIDFVGKVTVDQEGLASSQNHIIWYEDQSSVKAKQEYLKSRGINSFSYWAAGYF